jgi:PAS domain-containing protein
MRSPSLWLYLLGAVTFLVIALRRLRQRLEPLNDEVYSKQVAIDHVHSGVCWVRFDGTIGSLNPALAKTLAAIPRELVGSEWIRLFAAQDRPRVEQAYSEALLAGKASLEVVGLQRIDGTLAKADVLLVCVHDHKSRLIGHYCLVEDRTYSLELEDALRRLSPDHAVPEHADSEHVVRTRG